MLSFSTKESSPPAWVTPRLWLQYVFTDTINKVIFVTDNIAKGLTRHSVDFLPSKIAFDPRRSTVLLGYDSNIQSVRIATETV